MSLTRRQCFRKFFNEPDFGYDGSVKVVLFLKEIAKKLDLSKFLEIEMACMHIALKMTKGKEGHYHIFEIRDKVVALHQRNNVYNTFIRLPGVKTDVGIIIVNYCS